MPFFVIPYPIIDPVLIEIGPFAIRWYALSYIVGILLAWWYGRRIVANPALWGPKGSPISQRQIGDFVVWATLAIVVGGRLGYVLIYDSPRFMAEPLSILALWEGGLSFHGGFIAMVIAMVLFARWQRIPTLSLLDVIAATAPIAIFLVRVANFINGELYGRVTDVPWAMVFPAGGPEPRHPSQLYEAGLEGIALLILLWFLVYRAKWLRTPGLVAATFAIGYGTARTFAEFFRQPDVQIGFLAGGLTMGMLLSIPMIIAGLILFLWARGRPQRAATDAPKTQRSH